jgi:hypothetical protein
VFTNFVKFTLEKEETQMQNLKKYGLFLLMAVFVAAVAIAPAQAQGARLAADVPFDFAVGSAHFQAGSYTIKTEGGIGTFVAFSKDGGQGIYSLLYQASKSALHNGQPYLVFNRYGTESFLTKIVFDEDHSYNLPRSSREKEILARRTSDEEMEVPAGGSR